MTLVVRRSAVHALLQGMFLCAACAFAAREAAALPLFANDSGQACAACHVAGTATERMGEFVAGLSVNRSDRGGPADPYAALAAPPTYRLGEAGIQARGASLAFLSWQAGRGHRENRGAIPPAYGGGLGLFGQPGSAEARRLTVEGFWRPAQHWRLGAEYTLYNRPGAGAAEDASWSGPRDGSWFFYLRGAY